MVASTSRFRSSSDWFEPVTPTPPSSPASASPLPDDDRIAIRKPSRASRRAAAAPMLLPPAVTTATRSSATASPYLGDAPVGGPQPVRVDLDPPAGARRRRQAAVAHGDGRVEQAVLPRVVIRPLDRELEVAARISDRAHQVLGEDGDEREVGGVGRAGEIGSGRHLRRPKRPGETADVADVGLDDVDGAHRHHPPPLHRKQSCSPPATSRSSAPVTSAVHSSSQYGHGSSKWSTPCSSRNRPTS